MFSKYQCRSNVQALLEAHAIGRCRQTPAVVVHTLLLFVAVVQTELMVFCCPCFEHYNDIVMAYTVMAYVVIALCSYGLYSCGLFRTLQRSS